MGFKDEMRVFRNAPDIREHRDNKLNPKVYNEFAERVCQEIKNSMKEQITKGRFVSDKNFLGFRYNYRYEVLSWVGIGIYNKSVKDGMEDYLIGNHSDSWGDKIGIGLRVQYWEDIFFSFKALFKKLYTEQIGAYAYRIYGENGHPWQNLTTYYDDNKICYDIIKFMKSNINSNNTLISSLCQLSILTVIECDVKGNF